MSFDHLVNKRFATPELVKFLQQGTLTVFLGAGASMGAGLPDWVKLLTTLAAKAGIAPTLPPKPSAEDLQSLADDIKETLCPDDDAKFAQHVKACLYQGVTLSNDLIRDDLLIAVGALAMGSKRGKVSRVVTFNFDSVLEWYISLCGFVARVVPQLPSLEGSEDLRVYHPHGFLSHPDMKMADSNFVILGADAINLRLGTQGDLWLEKLRSILLSGVGLFIGTSTKTFSDRALAPLLASVAKTLNKSRPTAFWLLPDDGHTPLDRPKITKQLVRNGVVPIFFDRKEEIPGFILGVCRKAAQQVKI